MTGDKSGVSRVDPDAIDEFAVVIRGTTERLAELRRDMREVDTWVSDVGAPTFGTFAQAQLFASWHDTFRDQLLAALEMLEKNADTVAAKTPGIAQGFRDTEQANSAVASADPSRTGPT